MYKRSNSAITTNVCTFSSANAIVRFRWNESTDEDYTNTFNYPKQLLRYYHFFVLPYFKSVHKELDIEFDIDNIPKNCQVLFIK